MTGFGVVARALLPLLIRRLRVPCGHITVIDFNDREDVLAPWRKKGLRFVRERVTPQNLRRLLASYVGPGDLIIDLAWSIDFFDIVQWAHDNRTLYVNASLESWDPSAEMHQKTTFEKSLYARYLKVLPLVEAWRGSATAVVDHGANPGLVSHFVKRGLLDIAAREAGEKDVGAPRARKLRRLMEEQRFAELARALGVKVIHCSEWDTQRADKAKGSDEFVATWSVVAMWEEAISPSELGWGTHETWRPPFATEPELGPRNQIILPQMGLNTWVRSWVPDQEIVGMVVTHGESFGLSHALTVHRRGKPVYRPTVHYAYMPCNDSLVSLHELRCRNYELHPHARILADEISEGADVVGALIMGHRYKSWWTGSILSIAEARRLVPRVNATAVQVASGVLAAVLWTLRNPTQGVCLPEHLPHEEILAQARPYLGRMISAASDWTPLSQHRVFFDESPEGHFDQSDPWQFRNFLFKP